MFLLVREDGDQRIHGLGIPVKWAQISAARLIVESGLKNYRIDPSQGTHFFQNLTSFGVGYFTINPYINEGYYDVDYLNSMNVVYEDSSIRHIRFEKPLQIMIDGRKHKGAIMKPTLYGKECQIIALSAISLFTFLISPCRTHPGPTSINRSAPSAIILITLCVHFTGEVS